MRGGLDSLANVLERWFGDGRKWSMYWLFPSTHLLRLPPFLIWYHCWYHGWLKEVGVDGKHFVCIEWENVNSWINKSWDMSLIPVLDLCSFIKSWYWTGWSLKYFWCWNISILKIIVNNIMTIIQFFNLENKCYHHNLLRTILSSLIFMGISSPMSHFDAVFMLSLPIPKPVLHCLYLL